MWKFKEKEIVKVRKRQPVSLKQLRIFLKERKFGAVPTRAAFFERRDVLDRVYLESMKLLEMHEMDNGANVKHWIDKILANLDQTKRHIPLSAVYAIPCVKRFQELSRSIGMNEAKLLENEFGDSDGFIESIRTRMLTETKDDGPKYEAWFRLHGVQVDNERFRLFMKATALYFSNQLSEEDFGEFWSSPIQKLIHRSAINYRKISWDLDDIEHGIRVVLSGITCIDYRNE